MLRVVFFIAFLFYSMEAFAFSVSVSPVTLKLDSKQQVTSFAVINKSDKKMTFQLSTMKWSQKNGIDSTVNTNDLVVTPPIVTVPAGAEQIVRVGLRSPASHSVEAAYRVFLRQLPINDTVGSKYLKSAFNTGIKMILNLSVPLFVAPIQETKNINWEMKKVANDKLQLRLVNKGNVHVKITKLILQSTSGTIHFSPEVAGRVLAGQSKEWELSLKKPLTTNKITIKATTDWDGKDRELSTTVPVN